MGLLPSDIFLLARGQAGGLIHGSVLTLGQQAVWTTLEDVVRILRSQGLEPLPLPPGFDTKSKVNRHHPLWEGRTNAQAVLSLLGADTVQVADCSDYEDPDLLVDLNRAVPEDLFETFDVILDGGTLEHVFNVPMALRNINYMLKKGGCVIFFTPTCGWVDHGFYGINPTLYFDFFTANHYEDLSCYFCTCPSKGLFNLGFPYPTTLVYHYPHVGDQFEMAGSTVFMAKKGESCNSLDIVTPSQSLFSDANLLRMRDDYPGNDTGGGFFDMLKNLLPVRVKLSLKAILQMLGKAPPVHTHLKLIGKVTHSCHPVTFASRTQVHLL